MAKSCWLRNFFNMIINTRKPLVKFLEQLLLPMIPRLQNLLPWRTTVSEISIASHFKVIFIKLMEYFLEVQTNSSHIWRKFSNTFQWIKTAFKIRTKWNLWKTECKNSPKIWRNAINTSKSANLWSWSWDLIDQKTQKSLNRMSWKLSRQFNSMKS